MAHRLAATAAAVAVTLALPARASFSAALPPAGSEVRGRALALADRTVACVYTNATGLFRGEALWQSGNTIETLANAALLAGEPRKWYALFNNTYAKTPDIVDNCFDDHQWYLLAWLRAYNVTGDARFLQRAAVVFEYVVAHGWTTTPCGGGVLWCPTGNPYKNAISEGVACVGWMCRLHMIAGQWCVCGVCERVWLHGLDSRSQSRHFRAPPLRPAANELFLSSAMGLHPFAAALGKPPTYYRDWAVKEWEWLHGSGMINSDGLVNDGLDGTTCKNNGGTTWTYNVCLRDGATRVGSQRSIAHVPARRAPKPPFPHFPPCPRSKACC